MFLADSDDVISMQEGLLETHMKELKGIDIDIRSQDKYIKKLWRDSSLISLILVSISN